MKFFVVYISLLVPTVLFGQHQQKIDSLMGVIANAKTESARAMEYLELGNLYADKDSSYAYYQKALNLSRKIKYPKGISNTLVNLANWKHRYENKDSAKLTNRRAIRELKQYNYDPGIANHYVRLGYRFSREQQKDSADKYMDLGIDLAYKSKDRNAILTVLMIAGNRRSGKNSYEATLENYLKADSICRTSDSLYYGRKCAYIYEKTGDLFYNLTEYEKAKTYYFEAKSIHEFLGHPDGLHNINFSISGIYRQQKEYEKALKYIDSAINYYRAERPRNIKLIQALPERANIYYNLGQLDFAEKDYLEFLKKAKERKNNFYISRAHISLGNFYYKIKNYNKALLYSQQGFDMAKQRKDQRSQILAIKVIIGAHKELGNYKLLSQNWENYVQLRDSFDYAKLRTQVNELETKYETEKKEREIALLTSQNQLVAQQKRHQRNLLLGGIGLTSLVGIFFFFLYRNRQKTNKKLKEVDTLKSNFFANISHEFRTPLTLISAPLEKKLDSEDLNKTDRVDFELMQRNSKRLLNLVDQLLDLSKLGSGHVKLKVAQGDLSSLLRSLTSSFQHLAQQKNIKYSVKVGNSEHVWFDKNVIEKTVINLLSNAFKYTPDNGIINFETIIKNGHLEIIVENSGSTLSKEKADQIFNRFYQADDNADGVGIGLSLVKELVTLSYGTIAVENTSNNTILFRATLPISKTAFRKDELDPEAATDQVSPEYQQATTTLETKLTGDEILDEDQPILLIVEDNADVREFVKRSFSELYQILEAKNGTIGIEKAITFVPDIIISDIMMPGTNGLELCNQLKSDERTCHIPIILLTAKAGEEDQYKGLETGADDYITKPFKIKLLETRVQNLVASRKLLRDRYSQEVVLKPKDISITNLDEIFLERVQQVLDKKLTESSFSAEAFSKAVGMSRMQLHRKLKALTGLSASEFIRSQRLKLAASLLQKSDANISEIGYTVGFNDHAYFSKCFKKAYGCSPSEYMKS